MVDTYGLNEKNLNHFSSIANEFSFIYSDSVVSDFNFSIFLNEKLNINEDLTNIFDFIPIETIAEISSLKNNVDELVKIFPSMEDDIELLDL
jgi:hypothetical protein